MSRRIFKREYLWMGVSLVLVCLLVLGGRGLPPVSARENKSDLFQELKVFTDILSIVQRDYVEPVDNKKLVEGAIKGMLAVLDPHSGYLAPQFYRELQVETSGEFGGLGIEITLKDNLLVVVAPIEGSPAEAAGIKAGDAIIKIEGKFTKDLSLLDAVKQLRGPKGTPITISIFRKGEPDLIDVTIVRDKIQVKSVKSRPLGDGFGFVRISQFQEKTADDLGKALKKLKEAGGSGDLKGLILDLRNNPGGLLTQAIRVSDYFLDEGIIVYTDGRVENQKKKFFAHSRGTEPNYPIIVLVNGGSASASEIVAGALKDHGRALLLGTKTFGKGSVQTILPLDNKGALRLTTALYYTKSGRSLQATGVEPDIVMEISPEDKQDKNKDDQKKKRRLLRESDLPGAIHNPSGREDEKDDNSDKGKEVVLKPSAPIDIEKVDLQVLLDSDPQLARALDLLKTFNIFKGEEKKPVAQSDSA